MTMKAFEKTIVTATFLVTVLSLQTSMVHCFAVLVKSSSPSIQTPSVPPPTESLDKTAISNERSSSSAFKPWPEPLVISNGDYRNEMFLEDVIGGPLYAKQKDLPKLPLPTLQQTMETLIPTALPLAESEEEATNFKQAAKDFIQEAQYLQDRLVQRQHGEFQDSSWLQEMWQKAVYLKCRESLSAFVSYYLIVGEDKTLPDQSAFGNVHDVKKEEQQQQQQQRVFTKGIARAAAMLVATAEIRKQICSGEMPYETIPHKDGPEEPLCSTGFKYLFHACRIPTKEQDVVHLHDPSRYKHCIVASHGQFFTMDFCDEHQNPLPLAILEQRLQHCVQLGAWAEQQGLDKMPQLGWLTSINRDAWATARQELLTVGGDAMKEALFKMESAAFVINLDPDEPATLTEACNVYWSRGNGKNGGAANRWMDKSCQLICTQNGQVAYVGEHSMLDAAPTIPLIRRIVRTTYQKLANAAAGAASSQCQDAAAAASLQYQDDTNDDDDDDNDAVSNIFATVWSLSPAATLETAVRLSKMAQEQFTNLTSQYELQAFVFDGFGKKFLKQHDIFNSNKAGSSSSHHSHSSHADAIIQMAMQLAAVRLFHGRPVATYEAVLTRYFLHGRTATARPVSPSSLAFVQAMMGMDSGGGTTTTSAAEKRQALRLAVQGLQDYQEKASNGLCVDRHLFGLSMMQNAEEKHPIPKLFHNALYQRSKRWILSTSNFIYCPGFGPPAMTNNGNGLGIGYRIDGDSCMFTVTSRRRQEQAQPPEENSGSSTSVVGAFCELLQQALTEIGQLILLPDDDGEEEAAS